MCVYVCPLRWRSFIFILFIYLVFVSSFANFLSKLICIISARAIYALSHCICCSLAPNSSLTAATTATVTCTCMYVCVCPAVLHCYLTNAASACCLQNSQRNNATQRRVVALRLSLSLSSASVFLHKQRSKQHEPLSFSTATWPPLWKEREAAAVGEPAQAEAQRRQKSMNERRESVLVCVCVFCCCCLLRVCFHNRYACVCVWRREHFLHKLSVLAFNLN